MLPELTISSLYDAILALNQGAEHHDDLSVSAKLDHKDRLEIFIFDMKNNCEVIWSTTIRHISENIIGGFLAIGKAAGFIAGYDKAHEVEFIEDKEAA